MKTRILFGAALAVFVSSVAAHAASAADCDAVYFKEGAQVEIVTADFDTWSRTESVTGEDGQPLIKVTPCGAGEGEAATNPNPAFAVYLGPGVTAKIVRNGHCTFHENLTQTAIGMAPPIEGPLEEPEVRHDPKRGDVWRITSCD